VSFTAFIFMLGGLAVVGPLLAHLLAKPRFRRVPFTMLRFLRAGQVESQSRRRFRDLLMLLLRCAIIVLIAMLFAQPRLVAEQETEEPAAVYYLGLDNSQSMAYSDGTGSYFDKMVDSAKEYIGKGDERGEFNIFSLASGQWSKGLNKEQALGAVGKVAIVPDKADISDFVSALSERREKKGHSEVSVFLCSDFTKNTLKEFLEVSEPAKVDNISFKAIVSSKAVSNASITDAHVGGIVDGKLTLNVTVVNYGETSQSGLVRAKVGQESSEGVEVTVGVNERMVFPVSIDIKSAGKEDSYLPVELSLSSGDGLVEDDTFYLAVSLPEQKSINVVLLDSGIGETFLLKTAFKALSRMESFDTINVKQVLYSDFQVSDMGKADVIICSSIHSRLGGMSGELENFVSTGGKIVFFMTEKAESRSLMKLWQSGLISALPGDLVKGQARIEPRTLVSESGTMESDDVALKALSNYKLETIVLTGYFECKGHAESVCQWRLDNGYGFVYVKRFGNGSTVFINSSADDSLGGLTKSNASLAFCRYLLGRSTQIGEHSFRYGERALLDASEMEMQFADEKEFWVETCDGKKHRAAIAESLLIIPSAGGVGWVKTLAKPVRYAGINLVENETNMVRPATEQIAALTGRVFPVAPAEQVETAGVFSDNKYEPIWKIFAWIIIGLLLIEPVVANRLKR